MLSEHRHWLWLLARRRYYVAIWSTFIVGEIVRIRVEQAIRRGVERSVYRRRINDLVHLLSQVLVVASYQKKRARAHLSDPDDEPILATALAGRARFIVSLNTRDFPTDGLALDVRFVTPQRFLTELELHHSDARLADQAGEAGRLLP